MQTDSSSLPAGSQVRVVAADESRLVVFIPASGKRTRTLAIMAIIWNGICLFATGMFVFVAGQFAYGAPLLVFIPFIVLFWGAGAGLLFAWINLRFTRTHLLLERGRLVLQRILCGRKRLMETRLGSASRAGLVESYKENDVPIYAVAVNGENRTAKFGTALSKEEKDWFVQTINTFLGVPVEQKEQEIPRFPETCDACGTVLPASWVDPDLDVLTCRNCGKEHLAQIPTASVPDKPPVTPLRPAELPADSTVEILEATPDCLRWRLPSLAPGMIRSFAGWFALVLGIIWLGTAVYVLGNALAGEPGWTKGVALLLGGLAVILSAAPLAVGLFAYRGVIDGELTRDRFSCRWHLGPIGYQKRVPTVSITQVDVVSDWPRQDSLGNSRSHARKNDSGEDFKMCLVSAAGKLIPLTLNHGEIVARHVAGLVRHQLQQMGFGNQ